MFKLYTWTGMGSIIQMLTAKYGPLRQIWRTSALRNVLVNIYWKFVIPSLKEGSMFQFQPHDVGWNSFLQIFGSEI